MNKKGMALVIYGIMMAVFVFIIAVIMAQPISDFTETARDETHLNCSAVNLTTGTASTCMVMDIYLPAFIIAVLLGGLGAITYGYYRPKG